MKIRTCSHRKILNPCSLDMYKYQVDPYIGCEHLCYYCYALNDAETDWRKEILIHEDINQLSEEISLIEPQIIYMGMNSDPYQPCESSLKQTRKVLELFVERGFSASILTKSGLVTRDSDLFTRMPDSSVGISIAFQNDEIRRIFESKAPPNKERIEALKKLNSAGIETYTLICPVMPFITDVEYLIELVAPYSDTIWVYGLHMNSENAPNWQNVKSILDQYFPNMKEKYRKIAFSRDHPYWTGIRQNLEKIRLSKDVNLRIEL